MNNAKWGTDYLNRTAHRQVEHVRQPPGGNQVHLHGRRQPGQATQRSEHLCDHLCQGPGAAGQGVLVADFVQRLHICSIPNPLKRYSLGTKNKTLKYNADGSLTLYAGAKSPGKDKESNWLPAPDGTFSLYIRAYWADKAILDGTWQPPSIEEVSRRTAKR